MIDQPLNHNDQPQQHLPAINFTWKKLIIILIAFIALQFLIGFTVQYIDPTLLDNANNALLLNILANGLSVLVVFIVYRFSNVLNALWFDNMSFHYVTTEGLKWGALIVIANMGLGYLVSIIYALLGQSITPQNAATLMTSDQTSPLVIFLAIVIAAPIAEELLFRGVLFNTFRQQTKVVSAIIFSGLIFALIHFDPSFIPQLWMMGMLLAYCYHKSETLKVPIIAHMVVNLFSFIITMIFTYAS